MRLTLLKMLMVFGVLFTPFGVFGADWYVRAGGEGRGTSKEDPAEDPWKVMEKATRGDVIHVAQGTYNGKGGSGHFVVKVPGLSLVGGYNADFSARDPFKYHTILERAKDYKGDWTGLPEAIIAGDQKLDHSGLVIDGFVLNAESRNSYKNNVVAMKAPTYGGMLIQTYSANVKIKNNILLNPVGDGIYCTWQGTENEISNNFIINTFYAAIETRSAQPGSVILIKNNTIAFGWFYPTKGGHIGVFVGREGKTIIDSNVLAFSNTEGDEAGFGVTNTFGNDSTVMKNNVFFSNNGGFYKFMDGNKANLLVWKAKDLKDLNDPDLAKDFMLEESGGNQEADPGLNPDKDFAGKFANFIGSQPGKLNMDSMNQWRQAMGLPLQGEPGTARQNFGFPYPLKAVVPGLLSKIPGVGVQVPSSFPVYQSTAAAASNLSYEIVDFSSLKKGKPGAKGNNGRAIQVKGGLGDLKQIYELDQAPRSDYLCYQLVIPGSSSATTMEAIHIYIQKGSKAQKTWDDLFKKRINYFKDGITVKGRVFDFKAQSYSYPVGIIVDEVTK